MVIGMHNVVIFFSEKTIAEVFNLPASSRRLLVDFETEEEQVSTRETAKTPIRRGL